MKWCQIVVLIGISPKTNDVDYLFVWLLDICIVYLLFSETILQSSLSTFNQVAFLLLSGWGFFRCYKYK